VASPAARVRCGPGRGEQGGTEAGRHGHNNHSHTTSHNGMWLAGRIPPRTASVIGRVGGGASGWRWRMAGMSQRSGALGLLRGLAAAAPVRRNRRPCRGIGSTAGPGPITYAEWRRSQGHQGGQRDKGRDKGNVAAVCGAAGDLQEWRDARAVHPLSWPVWLSRGLLGPRPHSGGRRPGRAAPRNLSVPLRPTTGPGGAGPASRQSPGPPPRMTNSNAGDHRFRGRSRRAGAG
jgi:hypothetical protein